MAELAINGGKPVRGKAFHSWPVSDYGKWASLKMNQMVRTLQPRIIINNRARLPEDFSTPEGSVNPAEQGQG